MVKLKEPVEVIMTDGTIAFAEDVLESLIQSEVSNTIMQIHDEYDLTAPNDIQELSEMIAYYLETHTHIYIHPKQVVYEFQKQLKFS